MLVLASFRFRIIGLMSGIRDLWLSMVTDNWGLVKSDVLSYTIGLK